MKRRHPMRGRRVIVRVPDRRIDREGEVRGESKDRECWSVYFKDEHAKYEIHKSFCEVIDE